MSFADKLKLLRESNHLSQKELANIIGVTDRSLSNYESNKTFPDIIIAHKIADFFGVSLDYLISPEDEFIIETTDKYGNVGKVQAQKIIDETDKLFRSSNFTDEDRDYIFKAISNIYFEAKERRKKF